MIASAWAHGQVRQLEDRYAAGQGDCSALEQAIIATSLRFGVLCRFTAYVAVDRSATVNEGGELHKITQPVEMPAGWGEDAEVFHVACSTPPCEADIDDIVELSEMARPCAAHSSAVEDSRLKSRWIRSESRTAPMAPMARAASGQALPPPPPSTAEDLLREEGFTLLEEIGQDEHGTLYRGRDKSGQLVSVRILKNPVRVAGSEGLAKLQNELTRLKHPAIVPILRLVGDNRSGLVIAVVSAYVTGPNMAQWISQAGLPDSGVVARLVLILAEALEYAGRRAMIHGCLTADNIWIGDDGRPRITDFGLARLDCRPAVSLTTNRGYIAPELFQDPATQPAAQTDVYSLGVVFFRLLTGALPDKHQGTGRYRPPCAINPQVSAELDAICMQAMAADPARRYATWGELAADLRKAIGGKRPGFLGRFNRRTKPKPDTPVSGEEQRKDFWK